MDNTGLQTNQQGFAEFYNRETLKSQIRNNETMAKAQMEIWKNSELTRQKADIMSLREQQQTRVIIEVSGKVAVEKVTFQGLMRTPLQIELAESIFYFPMEQEVEGMVLKFVVTKGANWRRTVWLNQDSFDERRLKTKFLQAGIEFGFGSKKEAEIRRLFLAAVAESARFKKLPLKHGWYRVEDTFKYAYPSEIVWKDVCMYAK